MKIEFETSTLSVREGASLVAMMISLHGIDTIMAAVEKLAADIEGPRVMITGDAESMRTADDTFPPPPPPAADAVFAPPSVEAAPTVGAGETQVSAAAPAPPAPVAPVAGVPVDSAGMPWDKRIHSDTKGQTKDGTWRARRNVTPETLAAVTAELKATLAAPQPVAAPAAVPSPVTPPPPAAAPTVTPVEAAPVPPVAAPAVAAAPPPPAHAAPAPSAPPPPSEPAPPASPDPAPSAPPAARFAAIMRNVTEAQTAGRLTPENLTASYQALGLPTLAGLLQRPDLFDSFEATVNALMTPAAA